MRARIEDVPGRFDFITGRAVTSLSSLISLVGKKLTAGGKNRPAPGIIYLKGGDLSDELKDLKAEYRVYNLADHINDPYFETKKLVYLYHLFKYK
jgi:16S rRNA (guanine527-N7)-methyltransferase